MDPLHITEFASERYFSKLRQLNEAVEANAAAANGGRGSPAPDSTTSSVAPITPLTFTLPLGRPRPLIDKESLHRPEKRHNFRRNLGVLTAKRELGTKTNNSFSSFSSDRENSEAIRYESFLGLFFGLPPEIQIEIISRLSIPKLLSLRLASKGFYNLVASNESQIARYHIANTLPRYAVDLYPPPEADRARFYYLFAQWHRLHVASKYSGLVTEQATKEIFLRNTEQQRQEFRPQENRMRRKLMLRIFTINHFFERYRELHLGHIASSGVPLSRQAITRSPFESVIFESYSDDTLLKAHEAWPLVISSFSRRLRPPSYTSRIEKSIKGPFGREKPADEVYASILCFGGLRQACLFWNIEDYDARRTAVDTWYNLLTEKSDKFRAKPQKSKRGILLSRLGLAGQSVSTGDERQWCGQWYCVKPDCIPHNSAHDPIPNTSLSAGPPMSPLAKAELELFLPDLPHLSNIWIHTAEAVILDRGIKEKPQDIKRNAQVLLDLIQDDGTDLGDNWENILMDQTIEAPPSRDEWRSRERPTAEEPPSTSEQSGDTPTSESTPNVESTTSTDSGPRPEDMKPKDPHIRRIHTIELGRIVQRTEQPSSTPTRETATSIEPELSISKPPKVTNETEEAVLVPKPPSPPAETTFGELTDPTKSDSTFNIVASPTSPTNTSPEDPAFLDPQIFASVLRLMNLKSIFNTVWGVFFFCFYLLQQALGSFSEVWSQILGLETELPEGMSRVRWKCSCGASMYDDFIELRQSAAERLEKSLNEDYENNRSSYSRQSSSSSFGSLKRSSTTALNSFLSFLGLKREQPGLPHHEMGIIPGDSNTEGTNSTLPDPVWLLLCHDEGVYASKLAQIKISDFDSDQKLFSALRSEYRTLRGKWLSKISFRKLIDIKFVGFEVHSGDFVDIRPEEDIPPIDNTDYCYNPAPAELIPPVGHRHLMHLFQHPLHAQPKRVCYDRFPKKLRTRLACSDKPTELGWGLQLVEGWSLKKIWISGFVLTGIGSLVFGVVWVVLMHSIQDAFTVAAYWLTFGMFGIGTLQAILHLN